MYLMVACHKTGQTREALKYQSFLAENASKLDLDEKTRYERCLSLIATNT
jgi:hypothetical protein